MSRPVEFYFEFASPYGYLASLQIDTIAANHGREVEWRPVMLGEAFKQTGAVPNMHAPMKAPYLLHDVPRFARLLGAPLVLPPTMPMNSLAAGRAYWWLREEEPDLAKPLAEAVLFAHWGEGREMSAPEQVAEVAEPMGIAAGELVAAVQRPEIKARYKAETMHSIERGVFGSPFIFIDDEPFWGADRLDQIERWLRTGGW